MTQCLFSILFYDEFGRKIPYRLNFANILSHVLCKLRYFLSFLHSQHSLKSNLDVWQYLIHLLIPVFKIGFQTRTPTTSSTVPFSDLAVNKCDLSLNAFMGSFMI